MIPINNLAPWLKFSKPEFHNGKAGLWLSLLAHKFRLIPSTGITFVIPKKKKILGPLSKQTEIVNYLLQPTSHVNNDKLTIAFIVYLHRVNGLSYLQIVCKYLNNYIVHSMFLLFHYNNQFFCRKQILFFKCLFYDHCNKYNI